MSNFSSTNVNETMQTEHLVNVLVQVLNSLLKPGVEITDEQVGRLVKCVTGIPDNVVERSKLNGILQQWFLHALNLWEQIHPHPAVLTLALNFAVFLLSQERPFIELNEKNAVERFIRMLKATLQQLGATPDIGYVKLIASLTKHDAGCKWIIPTNHWMEILKLSTSSEQSSSLQQEQAAFISTLLLKCVDLNLDFFLKIIYVLLAPTIGLVEIMKKSKRVGERLFIENCLQSFSIFESVLETFLEKKSIKSMEIMLTAVEKCEFKKHLLDICCELSSDHINFKFLNVWYLVCFSEFVCKVKDTKVISYWEYLKFMEEYELMRRKLLPQYQKMFLQICINYMKYFSYAGDLIPNLRLSEDTTVCIGNTVMFLILMPIYYINSHFRTENEVDYHKDEFREVMTGKILKRIPHVLFYQFFQFKEYMKDNDLCPFEYAKRGLEYLLKSMHMWNKRNTRIAVKILIDALQDFNSLPSVVLDGPNKPVIISYLEDLIEATRVVVSYFDMKWQETAESMLLMEHMINTFSVTNYDSNVVAKGLELISVAFSKHLSLNMVFLTDQYDSDVIEKIIRICVEKITDDNYEIRRSAIKVIESVSNNVNEDYSSFKSLILENNLPIKMCEVSTKDPHPFVRASAFKCLQEMIRVEDFWKYIYERKDFYENLCQILCEDCSSTVRSEVSTLIAIIYEQHTLPTDVSVKFYDVMSYVINEDSSPIVRKSALQFWKNVIRQHLTMQGMIDGIFPDVTFSKESRKIIVLTQHEVKRRLAKVLHELSQNGCLSALTRASEDCDGEVFKFSKDILKDLYDLLNQYHMNILHIGIVDAVQLEEKIFEIPDIMETDICCKVRGRKVLRPDFFYEHVHDLLNSRKNSTESSQNIVLETLLNEILRQNSSQVFS